MTKREELIRKVRDGKVAILNDGTFEQLRDILEICFPYDKHETQAKGKFYEKDEFSEGIWCSDNKTSLPTVSVKEFYEDEVVNTSTKKWTNEDMIRLIQDLKNYTSESACVLGYDERDADELFEIFKQKSLLYEDEFVWGEEVEVMDYSIWEKAKYIGRNPNATANIFICINHRNVLLNIQVDKVRKLPLKTKLTHQMIADKFDIDVNNLEII